jgi:hypothetical protein
VQLSEPEGAGAAVWARSLLPAHARVPCAAVYGALRPAQRGGLTPELPSLPTVAELCKAARAWAGRVVRARGGWGEEVVAEGPRRWGGRSELLVLGSVGDMSGLLQPAAIMGQLCVDKVSAACMHAQAPREALWGALRRTVRRQATGEMELRDCTGGVGLCLWAGERGSQGQMSLVSWDGESEAPKVRGSDTVGAEEMGRVRRLPW